MNREEYYLLGRIIKTHALKGDAVIYLDVDVPENYKKLKTIYLEINGSLEPYEIERLKIRGKKSVIKFKGIDTIEDVEPIIKSEVYLPLSSLPKLKENQFYYHDVINFEIFESDKSLGHLKSIYESTGQDLFAIDIDKKEVLIPITDEFIEKIDYDNKTIHLVLPDGLLDIYLNN